MMSALQGSSSWKCAPDRLRTPKTAGTIVATRTSDAWGNVTGHTGTATPVSLGWYSQYQDSETGFSYLRARYYDPATGQFTTPDPLNALTGERYGYAGNDPVNG